MKAGGIGSGAHGRPLVLDPAEKNKKGAYNWTGLRRRGRDRRPRRAPGAAVPLRDPALARRASRRRCRSTTPGSAPHGRRSSPPRCERYGPGGEFWAKHAPAAASASHVPYEPATRPAPTQPLPIRTWQIWNEANFFYFAYPASPSRYAQLLVDLEPGDQSGRPGREGDPLRPLRQTDGGVPEGDARRRIPRTDSTGTRGSRAASTASPCTPTRSTPGSLEEYVEEFHDVTVENHDRVPALHHRDGLGLAARLPPGRLRAGAAGPGARSCAAPTTTCSKTAPGSTSSRSTGSPGRTSRATATSATRSASSTKARPSARSRPGRPSSQISRGRLRP